MKIVHSAIELRAGLGEWRREGLAVGLVPTMGALHEGHLSLVRLARERLGERGRIVTSVFVNPKQFAPLEDFSRYPRTPERDAAKLEAAGCDLLFLPEVATIYPPGHSTHVAVDGPSRGFESDFRPGHFEGVATVVTALFLLVAPDVAVFGEKDAQQLAVVRRLVDDLHFPIEIVPGPTVREADGVAMSSRNDYLSAGERQRARVLHRALASAAALKAGGETSASRLEAEIRRVIASEPGVELQYVAIVDGESFAPLESIGRAYGETVIAIAARIGLTRLLDNIRFRSKSDRS